jgi:beta-lactamase regulating signal transducer with metallopeptidase domain
LSIVVTFIGTLLIASVFSLLALKLPTFNRKKVILRVFIVSILMILLTPVIFVAGFYLSRTMGIEYSNFSSILSQCEEALHRCSVFVKNPENLYIGFKIFFILLSIGIFLVAFKRVYQYLKGYWILKKSTPLDLSRYPKLKRALNKALEKADLRNRVEVYLRDADGPYIGIFGIFHPRILVSENLIDSLEEEELEAVILHEIGHLKFMDNLWGLILGAIKDLFFFFLPFKLLHSAYEEEKEYAVDKWVRDLQGDPLPLAYALIKVSRKVPQGDISSTLSLVPEGSHLSKRIKNLIEIREERKNKRFLGTLFMAFLLTVLASFTLGFMEGRSYVEKNREIKCLPSSSENLSFFSYPVCTNCITEH